MQGEREKKDAFFKGISWKNVLPSCKTLSGAPSFKVVSFIPNMDQRKNRLANRLIRKENRENQSHLGTNEI